MRSNTEKKFFSLFKKSVKMPLSQLIVFIIAFILFSLYAYTIIYAIGWGFISSLRPRIDLVNYPFEWPEKLYLKNYVTAFNRMNVNGCNMVVLILNSLWYTIGGTIINVCCALTLSYVVSKYKFFGRNLIYAISVIILILPIVGSLPATYKLIKTLGIDNSPLILLTFTSGFGFNFIVLYGFFSNVSWSYAEAGKIDGASDFIIFYKIMLPQAMPAIVSLMIIAAIATWNDYQGPLLYLEKMPTLSAGIYLYQTEVERTGDYHILYAAINLSLIPILILFLGFQGTIMSNTVAGGLKG